MRIETGAAYYAYQKNMSSRKESSSLAQPQAASSGTRDTVEIRQRPAGNLDAQVRKSASETEAVASPARLKALAQSIQKGEYHVSSQDLADAMMGELRA